MQFQGKITEADLNDVRTMNLSKIYWPRLLLANWYGLALILAILWATISGLLGKTNPNWRAVFLIWVLVGAIVIWSIYRTKREQSRELAELNATLPDQIEVTNAGVKWEGPNGRTGFVPCDNFKGWREGKRVMLVDERQGNRFVMLPISQLSEAERVPIRNSLQSHISPTSFNS
jgi:MFS family permease